MGLAIVAALAWVGLLRRQVRAQTKMILEISNREQRRIGHDLHDGVCQQLAGIALMSSTLSDDLDEQGAPQAAQADRISALINEVIDHTRSVARGLFPIWLEEHGLGSALDELAENASEIFNIECRFEQEKDSGEIENTIALHLYYIALEAVANAAKHGRAPHVWIRLRSTTGQCSLTVRDDGTGFVVGQTAAAGMGLRIMRYRARMIGSQLRVKSKPGSGTEVSCAVTLPTRPASRLESARQSEPAGRQMSKT
jgi:two-component system CheB/CheR fusion protein